MSEPTKYPLADLVEALSAELREANRRASNREDGPAFDLESATAELAIGWETNKDGGIDFQVFKLGGSLTRNNTSTLSVTVRPGRSLHEVRRQSLEGPDLNEGYAVGLIASDRLPSVFELPEPFGSAPKPEGLYHAVFETLRREPGGLSERALNVALERTLSDTLTPADWRPSKRGVPAWHRRVRRTLGVLKNVALVVFDNSTKVWRLSSLGIVYLRSVDRLAATP